MSVFTSLPWQYVGKKAAEDYSKSFVYYVSNTLAFCQEL